MIILRWLNHETRIKGERESDVRENRRSLFLLVFIFFISRRDTIIVIPFLRMSQEKSKNLYTVEIKIFN